MDEDRWGQIAAVIGGLVVLAFFVLMSWGCATSRVAVTTINPDGSSETVELKARVVFSSIEDAKQAAAIDVENDGAYSVDTGQAVQGLDSTKAMEMAMEAVGSAFKTVAGMPPGTIRAFRGPEQPQDDGLDPVD
jgi:hypothetical protein